MTNRKPRVKIISAPPPIPRRHAGQVGNVVPHDDSDQRVDNIALPLKAFKGRGAVSNLQGRYELHTRERTDDGWQYYDDGDEDNDGNNDDAGHRSGIDNAAARRTGDPRPPSTQVIFERARSILTRNRSPDLPFDVSLNPYRGCEHGCIYCFARPTHAYLGLSPGLDFESRIFAKINAPELLLRELAKPSYRPESIALGVITDAYQPCERALQLTRRLIRILHDCEHPVALITKSSLIERDIDLLAAMAAKGQAATAITITTLDPEIARTLEPRAAAPSRRLRTIRTLAEAGIPVSVSIAPVIPFVTEPELERIMEAALEAGAVNAGYTVLRLPWEVNPLFQQWLLAHFPERAQRVMNRVRDMRGGKDYDADFATRMHGSGVWADLIRRRFELAATRCGLGKHGRGFRLDASRFAAPPMPPKNTDPPDAAGRAQMNLF